ncbi:hypothetical protein AURDEDRAFT_165052 [Auricularia subglabra TFB-10046 SS5]|nr:hypothetical protein AURDEDRAFT_165052 [Auricularia subglabra TFB-10046 SS5]
MQNAQLSELRLPSLRSLRFHTGDEAGAVHAPPTPTSASSHHPQQPWPRAPDAPQSSAPRPAASLDRYGPPPAYSFEPAPSLVPAVVAGAGGGEHQQQQQPQPQHCWPPPPPSQASQARVGLSETGTYNGTMQEPPRARTMQTPFRFEPPQPSPFDIQPATGAPRDQHEFAAPAPFYPSPDAHSRPATMQQQQQQYPAPPMPPAWTPTSLSPSTISPLDSMSEKLKPGADNRNKSISPPDIIAKIVLHCNRLCEFAAKYEPVPQAPPDDEVDEMAELALSVVRLIEDLHRVTIGMDEPLPPFSPSILADLGVPCEPSAQSDADREAATPPSSEAAAERGRKRSWDEMASSERESQADRDMAIIRAKRMAQVAQAANSASGSSAPQSKAKYKKRSPGLKRAMPPEKCQACYNSETPEWRRGPYGARTLCNACGIHYSKMKSKRDGGESDPDEDMAELRRTVTRNPAEGGGRARRTKRAHSGSTSKQFVGGGEFQVAQSSAMASHAPSPPAPLPISPEIHAPRPTQQVPFVNDPNLQNRPPPPIGDPTMQAQHRSLPAFVDYSRQQTAHLPQMTADDRYFQGGMPQSIPQQNAYAAEPAYPPPSGGGNPLMLNTYSIRSAPSGPAPQPYGHAPSNVRSSPHLAS